MSVKNTHPDYDNSLPDILMARDFYLGERVVKRKETTYLKPTVAQVLDGMGKGDKGRASYEKYIEGARFPDLFNQAVENTLGVMHGEDPVIQVPTKMEPILQKITRQGETVYGLLRRINEEQLIPGRLGLLLDVDENTDLPYISLFNAESVTNWDEGILESGTVANLKMVVLYEPQTTLDSELQWTTKEMFRVCILSGNESGKSIYQTGVFEDTFDSALLKPVQLIGKSLEKIPFVFINTKDSLTKPDLPPFIGLVNEVLGIYRSEANYRYHLYMQSQDTLVRIGHMRTIENENETVRTGAGAVLDVSIGGDAKFIGVNSQGLTEERLALENDYKRAEEKALKLLDKKSSESGEALITRKNSQTASITQIAKTSCAALETILKMMAEWMSLNPDEVIVTPFTEFGDVSITAKDVIDMMTAKTMGAPISQETIHERMREGGLTDKTIDEEITAIAGEDDVPMRTGTDGDR
ncbi:DUF4055 domain-containing protein [Nitrosomonas ureae]|uniref:DUF4055 domain-containing protein n=1 Tax=Nitrosomonas ureae TaxID=44577 RepID=A0A286A263_9PROT|nr:DUF4055 domain-containing protein [Nitrosomonas ureae]SOD15951.1 protein of unknown function [Nitrosomonas ureae]